MLKISKLTDYGTLVMGGLAAHGEEFVSTADLAEAIGVAQPTVAKLLKMFTRAGLVESLRGQQGGYRLGRAPEKISVADIIQAVDGPLGLTECSTDEGHCDQEESCNVKVNWQKISRVVADALQRVSLTELLQPAEQQLLYVSNADVKSISKISLKQSSINII
ncbi:MAG: SUF system Fe-S cluster assembly regulator [Gammaproteobacteria bacterium]|nr:MAG: SUF system Fe-S cluster assembly regulator [Gammaproteobacteria bacterium]RLA13372.1 MAG: SUF system Fe-S cluster assembly regulator [Gammaproteobacteria bacterium]RLA14513.1 MAG: SUF system Fe-S cluster assembly regulator [Gammaproteobacteria bacterium]